MRKSAMLTTLSFSTANQRKNLSDGVTASCQHCSRGDTASSRCGPNVNSIRTNKLPIAAEMSPFGATGRCNSILATAMKHDSKVTGKLYSCSVDG